MARYIKLDFTNLTIPVSNTKSGRIFQKLKQLKIFQQASFGENRDDDILRITEDGTTVENANAMPAVKY